MSPQNLYDDLVRRVREAGVLASCAGLLGWDERTYMPRAGAAHRGEQMALLARLGHEMLPAPRVGERRAGVEGRPPAASPETDAAANVREIRRDYDRATKLPKE